MVTSFAAVPTGSIENKIESLVKKEQQGTRHLSSESALPFPAKKSSNGSRVSSGAITGKRTEEQKVQTNKQARSSESAAIVETSAEDIEEGASMQPTSEEELFNFVRKFVNESVGRKTVAPKVVEAAREAGFVLKRGGLPELLKKHPQTFKYNADSQYIQLVREQDREGQTAEELTFEEQERQFIKFLTALLQERPMPEDGIFISWVSQLARHPSSALNLTGLPKLTRMIAKHLDLFKVEGFGTTLLRVSLTEQGRLRVVPPLPREFRLYLRSDEAQLYRDGIWTEKEKRLGRKEEEEKAQALTEEELKVVLFLMREANAKGPGGAYRLSQAGVPIRKLGLRVRGKPPRLSNIAFRSRDIFEVRNWGTPYVEISLTEEGWEAAEKLQHVELSSASEREARPVRTEEEPGRPEKHTVADNTPD